MLFVIDLETTSLRPEKGGVWDIGVVALQDGRIAGEFQTLVWPGRQCLQKEHLDVVQRVSGIEPGRLLRMLTDTETPDVPVARERLITWLYTHLNVKRCGEDVRGPKCIYPQCDGAGFWWEPGAGGKQQQRWCPHCQGTGRLELPRTRIKLTAFNRPFDLGWLKAQPWDLGWFVPGLGHAELIEAPCVMAEAAAAMKVGARVKLASACAHYGINPGTAHRAIDDARAAAELAIKLGMCPASTPEPALLCA